MTTETHYPYRFQLAARVARKVRGAKGPGICLTFRIIVPELGLAAPQPSTNRTPVGSLGDAPEDVWDLLVERLAPLGYPASTVARPYVPSPKAFGACYVNVVCCGYFEIPGTKQQAVRWCEELIRDVANLCEGGPLEFWREGSKVEVATG